MFYSDEVQQTGRDEAVVEYNPKHGANLSFIDGDVCGTGVYVSPAAMQLVMGSNGFLSPGAVASAEDRTDRYMMQFWQNDKVLTIQDKLEQMSDARRDDFFKEEVKTGDVTKWNKKKKS